MKLSTSNRGSEAEDTKKKGCTDESPICHRLANLINLRAIPATSIKYLYRTFNLDVPRTLYEINSAVAPWQDLYEFKISQRFWRFLYQTQAWRLSIMG
jgi:hypothetical protein